MPTAFPPRADLIPAGALTPANFKVQLAALYDAVVALLGTDGETATARGLLGAAASADLTKLSIQGAHKNLRSSSTGASADITITADEICVKAADNTYQTLRAVNVTVSGATSGANGLDTGVLTGSTIYHKWVIWDGATVAGLLSLSDTAPTMPSGYTHKARAGAIPTDGTANKYPLSHKSFGADTDLIVGSTTNLVNRPGLIAGIQGNAFTPVYVAASMASFVPSTACRVRGNAGAGAGASTSMMLAPSDQYGAATASVNSPPVALNTTNTAGSIPFDFAIESTNLYYACNVAGGYVYLGGWRDTI